MLDPIVVVVGLVGIIIVVYHRRLSHTGQLQLLHSDYIFKKQNKLQNIFFFDMINILFHFLLFLSSFAQINSRIISILIRSKNIFCFSYNLQSTPSPSHSTNSHSTILSIGCWTKNMYAEVSVCVDQSFNLFNQQM